MHGCWPHSNTKPKISNYLLINNHLFHMHALFYSFLAGFSTIIGVIFIIYQRKWALRYSRYFNSFAAGIILSLVFFHLLPESIELSDKSLIFCIIGFMVFYLLETFLIIHSGPEVHYHQDHDHKSHAKGKVAFCGIFLHSLMDGIIIGIGFEISTELGLLAALGVILHELPEGIMTFSVLTEKLRRKTALYLSLAVALATPLGTIISILFIKQMSKDIIGIMLSIAAGSFLYIAASDLIPETHQEKGFKNALCLVAGVILIYLL
jgi:ZIP family zinc transporter/zinc and cadmium transporter